MNICTRFLWMLTTREDKTPGDKLSWTAFPEDYKERFKGRCGPHSMKGGASFLIFTIACKLHDFGYYVGGGEYDRKEADEQFFVNMRTISKIETAKIKRVLWLWTAHVFYWCVRCFGWLFFTYGAFNDKDAIIQRNERLTK